MALDYNIEFCKSLNSRYEQLGLFRPKYPGRYEPGTELVYDFEPVGGGEKVKVKLIVEHFVGGGFAGQVYKVKILEIAKPEVCPELSVGKICAIKILIPPSGFSKLFRNFLYWVGFGGPFQLQVNPAAAKAGALWQKFIRRAAGIKFGSAGGCLTADERSVVDIYGTFVDNQMGSCGELSEWIDGRTWRLEVDDHIGLLKKWRKGKKLNTEKLGSPEYRTKHIFMHEFVKLLHEVGAHEFARQYEWTTLKSQPNCLKRLDTGNEPEKGLVAVDFRAGLALLPFLPMSPGDIKLIWQGLNRGSLVQFDRGDLNKLKSYIDDHKEHFSDMQDLFDKLTEADDIYRNSIPDITHNHIRLLSSGKLWSTIFSSAVIGWRVRNIIDEKSFEKLRNSKFKTFFFFLLGLLPILGSCFRKFWCHEYWRKHYIGILTSAGYFKKALNGKIIELSMSWYRAGAISQAKAEKFLQQRWRILYHLPFLLLVFPFLHRLLTDWQFAKEKLYYLTVRPVRLYFNAELRKQWLGDMVEQGQKKHILADEDAQTILSQINEPFIDKYLKSLAVHICTLPVTQIVSVAIAVIYWLTHRSDPNAWAVGLGIIAIFQVVPISPGSLTRGLYVVYMVIKDRSFKDYNIAVFLGFFKYVGYLAFPIQMTYRYPALARFMAAHWATDAVHIVPVFGERGALLEHAIFCIFYNWPLTIRRRMQARAALREKLTVRYWHILPIAIAAVMVLKFFVQWHFNTAVILISLIGGALTTIYCGKAGLLKRFTTAAAGGFFTAIVYTLLGVIMNGEPATDIIISAIWRCFGFTIVSIIGAIFTEMLLPDVENRLN
ncbi:MAG: hypothetical protein KJ757_07640 [Planctomycetes bacterium]|nr:hypothetical protein [Planctomycetota bacterium]MBU1517578.1 hypothetical protein [Planctomycetota bacterium]MBU2457032.1 hypothetical protein [Planctomycetota bacterium]MBU2597413.1 hypothetical protein [Planctomycetota bacterium]